MATGGRFRWRGSWIRLSRCLAGEPVGLRQVDDDRWEVWYGPLTLGVIDDRGGKSRFMQAEARGFSGSGTGSPVPGDRGAVPVPDEQVRVSEEAGICPGGS